MNLHPITLRVFERLPRFYNAQPIAAVWPEAAGERRLNRELAQVALDQVADLVEAGHLEKRDNHPGLPRYRRTCAVDDLPAPWPPQGWQLPGTVTQAVADGYEAQLREMYPVAREIGEGQFVLAEEVTAL